MDIDRLLEGINLIRFVLGTEIKSIEVSKPVYDYLKWEARQRSWRYRAENTRGILTVYGITIKQEKNNGTTLTNQE